MHPIAASIVAYEAGELSATETVELFGTLIESGLAWTLQGHFGRTAASLIDAGWLDPSGAILRYPEGD